MATLSQSQIYTIAVITGMPNPKVMAAIAMAESSGRTDVVNSIGCVGLWQINQPVHVKANPKWTRQWLQNPFNNALAAKKILASQGLRAWEVYTNGMYAKYLNKTVAVDQTAIQTGSSLGIQPGSTVTQAGLWDDFWDGLKKGWDFGPGPEDLGDGGTGNDPGIDDVPVVGEAKATAEALLGIAETLQKAGAWMSKAENWVRVGYVAGGSLLVIFALYQIASPALTKALPQAKALKALIPSGGGAPAKAPSQSITKNERAAKAREGGN